MLRGDRTTTAAPSAEVRADRYLAWLRSETATATTADDKASEAPWDKTVTITEAAAQVSDRQAPATVAADARDMLIIGMVMARIDVSTVAQECQQRHFIDTSATALQQQLIGKKAMTLAEYATIEHVIAEHR